MNFVPIDNIEEGMIIVKGIYTNSGRKLLASNTTLSLKNIERIKKLGYTGLYVYDNLFNNDELHELIDEKTRINAIKSLKKLDMDLIIFCANNIVNSLIKEKSFLIELSDLENYHDYTFQHSVDVAILSAIIGIGFGFDDKKLKEITIASLLHDIGKSDIPSEILDKPDKLTQEEYSIVKEHSLLGYQKLIDNEKITEETKIAILQHHENEDGTGYPHKIKGDEIHIFSKIIHIADVFDALISERSYKKAFEPSEALEYLMGNAGSMFDINVIKIFIKYVAIYQPGTIVKLSNGILAVVIKNNAEIPLRPIIKRLDNDKIIDLYRNKNYLNETIIESNLKNKSFC